MIRRLTPAFYSAGKLTIVDNMYVLEYDDGTYWIIVDDYGCFLNEEYDVEVVTRFISTPWEE